MDRPGGLSVDSSTNHLRAPSRTVTLGRTPTCRTVYCNDRDANYAVRFKGNSISTTKYNVFTFLPKGLFEQLESNYVLSDSLGALPREISKHTGFAFDSPGYESFFASQLGIYAPQKAWDAARRASMRSRPKAPKKN